MSRSSTRGVAVGAGHEFTPDELRELARHAATDPARAARGHRAPPVEPLLVVAGAGSGKTETMAAAGGLAGRQRATSARSRSSASPSPARRPASWRTASGCCLGQLAAAARPRRPSSPASRRSPPTTRYAGPGGRASTACAPASSRPPGCSPRRRAGSSPTPSCASYDGDMTAVPLGAVDRRPTPCCTSPASWPSTCATPDDVAACTGRFFAEVERHVRQDAQAACRTCSPASRRRLALLPAGAARTRQRKAALEAMDFGDQLRRAARGRPRPPRGGRGRAGPVPGGAARRVPGHLPGPGGPAALAVRRRPSGDRGRRPVPVHLRLARRQRGHPGPVPDRLPDADGAPAADAAAHHELAQRARRSSTSPTRCPTRCGSDGARGRPARRRRRPRRAGRRPRPVALRAARHVRRRGRLDRRPDRRVWRWRRRCPERPPTSRSRPPTTAVLVRARAQIPALETALRARGPAGRGRRPRRPARHPRGPRRRQHAAGARRPDRGRGAAAAADRRRGGGSGRATWSRSTAGPARLAAAAPSRRRGRGPSRALADRLDEAVLVEALDDLGDAGGVLGRGFAPLRRARRDELRGLRRRLDQPLPDLVADIERTIGLDVEVAPRRPRATPAWPGPTSTRSATSRPASPSESEGADARRVPGLPGRRRGRGARPGAGRGRGRRRARCRSSPSHAAKGLEWDVVSVAGLCVDVFPAEPNAGDHWLRRRSACCRSRCAATATACPSLDLPARRRRGRARRVRARFDDDWQATTTSGRSAGWPTSP